MSGQTISGEDGTNPYDSGADFTTIQSPATQFAASNWDSSTIPATQEIGWPDNYLICDLSGFRVSVAEGLVESFYGWKTRKQDWDPRHPQDFVRAGAERERKGSPRPEQDDVFLDTNDVSADDL